MTVDFEDFEYAVAARFRRPVPIETVPLARTPRELATLLAPNFPDRENPVSLTARAFYRIRNWVAESIDVDPRSIHASTRWTDLLQDRAIRRIVWTHFRELLEIRQAPRLHRPRAVTWPIAIISGAVALVVMVGMTPIGLTPGLHFLAGALVVGLVAWFLLGLTRPWAREFIPAELTVGDVAHYVVVYGSPILGDMAQPSNVGQTLEVVRSLARLEIGAPRVDPDATWEQLGHLAQSS